MAAQSSRAELRADSTSCARAARARAACGRRVVGSARDLECPGDRDPPRPNDLGYGYAVQFLLSEVSGKSGATITNIRTSAGGNSDNTGPLCWRDPIRVEPGGTLDTFDAGWEALAYCAPSFGSQGSVPSLSVLVTFVDDDGRAGSVAATVNVTR